MKQNFIRTIQNSKVLKMVMCCFLCLSLLINFGGTLSAYAAPAVVPLVAVGAEALWGLLAAMGVAVAAGAGYVLSQEYPFIEQTFSAFGDTPEDYIKALPSDYYYTDGAGNYYILQNGEQIVVSSPSQLVFNGSAVLTQSDSVPMNIDYIPAVIRGNSCGWVVDIQETWDLYGTNVWWTPYYIYDGQVYTMHYSWTFNRERVLAYKFTDAASEEFTPNAGILGSWSEAWVTYPWGRKVVMDMPTYDTTYVYATPYYQIDSENHMLYINSGAPSGTKYAGMFWGRTNYYPSAADDNAYAFRSDFLNTNEIQGGYLVSKERPSLALDIDKSKLDGTYISVGTGATPPDNNGDENKNYELVPPSAWEIFATLQDIVSKTPSNNTNNGTTLGDFVNNNYNYNKVDVNVDVPDAFDFKISGSLDLNIKQDITLGGGVNINVNIDDKTELPSVTDGDGENFFSANVIDVFAGLTKNNPVMSVLTALFGIIDPALVAVFSVTLSLGFLLALWRLIRR